MTSPKPAPAADLDLIVTTLGDLPLRQENILLTGGTGFFGKWLVQTLLAFNDRQNAGNHISIVTRDIKHAQNELPWINGRRDIDLIESDIRSLKLRSAHFSTIIHGATSASRTLNENSPQEMYETIVEGTKATLKIAEKSKCHRFQFISSGAVYGPQPPDLVYIPEDYMGHLSLNDSAYGQAKKAAESLALSAHKQMGFHLSIPRGFTFLGPYLPLHSHFAAGNFIGAILDNKPIFIQGDGRTVRSYLYSADLMIWLLKMLLQNEPLSILNVGSKRRLTVLELAQCVHKIACQLFPSRKEIKDPIQIALPPQSGSPHHYVPDTSKAHQTLNLQEWTSLESAIERTLRWHLEA